MQLQLVLSDGLAQLVLQCVLGGCLSGQLGIDETQAGPAVALGRIHRGIRQLDQSVGVGAVVRRHRNPDRGATVKDVAAAFVWALDRAECLFGQSCHLTALVQVLQQHRKLVAAQARDQVFLAEHLEKTVADLDQQLVAGRVSVAVVYLLEPVQVHEQQPHQHLMSSRRLDRGS